MAYEGYLRFGGNEVINNERAMGYSRTAECPMVWLKGPRCDTLERAVEGSIGNYVATNIGAAPWYDLSTPDVSGRFYGVFGLSTVGLNSSTRSAPVVEGIGDGGQIGRSRKGVRTVRAKVILIARGRDALDYGVAWLSAVLDPNACGQHGNACGTTDVEFITDCPAELPPAASPEEIAAFERDYTSKRRFLHGAAVTSGPLEAEIMNIGPFWAQVVEFTITAGRPWVYTVTQDVDVPITPSVVVQDIPYNLVTHPSAAIAGPDVTVARNFSPNPSVEIDASHWESALDVVSGDDPPSGSVTGARSTDIAAGVGVASYRVRFLGTAAAATGRIRLRAEQEIDLSELEDRTRVSLTVWAAMFILAGETVSTLHELRAYAVWGDDWRTDEIGATTSDFGGTVFDLSSIMPPLGAQKVRIVVAGEATWTSGGATPSDIRLYADTLGVTVP